MFNQNHRGVANMAILEVPFIFNANHDGIGDGPEYHYWQNKLKEVHPDWDNDTINSTAISYCKNPDVDGDSIPDIYNNRDDNDGFAIKQLSQQMPP